MRKPRRVGEWRSASERADLCVGTRIRHWWKPPTEERASTGASERSRRVFGDVLIVGFNNGRRDWPKYISLISKGDVLSDILFRRYYAVTPLNEN
ncbi:hypothetical protein GWI33_013777 [Rhynchophorus ferrugineus]|uniref:Uncharacterized protein n=1 Tax=Rhynchophorus ferrugineus TaxID=354439 RepID=A0A834I400_RHYFE|nr:hypothetical protein GWI33_013777 [Rhynchophorus ferrugineus]